MLQKCCASFINNLFCITSQANPNCLLIVTPKGGHLGWVAGENAPVGCPWTDPMVMDFLKHLENEKSSTLQGSNNELQSVEV